MHLAGPRGAQTFLDALLSVSLGSFSKGFEELQGSRDVPSKPHLGSPGGVTASPQGKRQSICLFSAVLGGQEEPT